MELLNDIVNIVKQDENNIGLIVYGSYVTGYNRELSDLDIMIIRKYSDTREVGSSMYKNIRIEYFVNGLNTIYSNLKKQVEYNDPSHLTKFSTCRILYDKTGEVKEVVDYALELYKIKATHQIDDDDRCALWSINNRMEDLFKDDVAFYSIYYVVLERIRLLYMRINNILALPLTKFIKLMSYKEYLNAYVNSNIHNMPDDKFIELYKKCLVVDDNMLNNLKNLYDYSFSCMEFDPANFRLKYEITKKAPWKI